MIVLPISCPSFPLSDLTYCHFLFFYFVPLFGLGFFCDHRGIDQFQEEFVTASLALWGILRYQNVSAEFAPLTISDIAVNVPNLRKSSPEGSQETGKFAVS